MSGKMWMFKRRDSIMDWVSLEISIGLRGADKIPTNIIATMKNNHTVVK